MEFVPMNRDEFHMALKKQLYSYEIAMTQKSQTEMIRQLTDARLFNTTIKNQIIYV